MFQTVLYLLSHRKYIATCSDDTMVLVLHRGVELAYVPLGEKEMNHESWDVFRTYRGHSADVLHLEWSPDGTRLASCGVDNLVMVWQLSEASGACRRLSHQGHVKGLSWDPVGKYLAAQVEGHNKSLVVWRVRDWQVESGWAPKRSGHMVLARDRLFVDAASA